MGGVPWCGLVGPAGIGKSRLVREIAAVAAADGVDVFCVEAESHSIELPFTIATRLLRSILGLVEPGIWTRNPPESR